MNERDTRTRAEIVGSMLRPPQVQRAVRPDAPPAGAELLNAAVLDAIRVQREAGLDIITDGETRRRSWAETPYFLDCFASVPTTHGLVWHGADSSDAGRAAPRLVNTSVVVRKVSEAAELGDRTAQYAFLARHAKGTRTKFTMAAPSYHRRYWSDEHSAVAYASADEFLLEIRDYLRGVVAKLQALGCDYIQLDAPNYGSWCDPSYRAQQAAEGHDVEAEIDFDVDLDNSLFDGVTGVTRALHICRGNAAGGRWHSSGGYGPISGQLFGRLEFDRLLLEYDSDRAGTFSPLRDVKPGVVTVLGLLSTKTGELEDDQLVRNRIAEAATIKPLGELALSTQCGFASVAAGNPVTQQQQQRKLELVAKVAQNIWPARC